MVSGCFPAGFRTLDDMFTDVNGDRLDAENVAVLVTDGLPAWRELVIRRAADVTKANDIRIIVVGICEEVRPSLVYHHLFEAVNFVSCRHEIITKIYNIVYIC